MLEWINEDDFKNINIDLPLPDILMLGEYRRSSYASEARSVIGSISNSSDMFYQTNGEWPSSTEDLERQGQLNLNRSTKAKWQFELQLSDEGGQIIATSTEEMLGGGGHQVIFNRETGKFTGYGSKSEE